MKLQRIARTVADRLHLESVAFGQQLGAARQVKTFAVPLVDAFRPLLDDGKAGGGGPDRVIANLGAALGMAKHLAAELAREHLRAETDAEIGLVLAQAARRSNRSRAG
jgi:hypothetical protein